MQLFTTISRIPKGLLYIKLDLISFTVRTLTSSSACSLPNQVQNANFPQLYHNHRHLCNNFSTTRVTPSISTATSPKPKKKSVSFTQRVREWLNWDKKPPKRLLRTSGYVWYVKIADEINFETFYKVCHLPDTFWSWFTVIELHVWILSTRLMEEPESGKVIRNALIRAMWEDVDKRSKKLEGALASARRVQIRELNEQFQAALLGYDEGLLSTKDTVLAGALWRKFLRPIMSASEIEDVAHQDVKVNSGEPKKTKLLLDEVIALELLVQYVRSEHYNLQQLSRERILYDRDYKWTPLDRHLAELRKFYT